MAKDVLVIEGLTDSMVKAGENLIKKLDETHADVSSAFWFYLTEDKMWRLIISSPLVTEVGPREFYVRINDVNSEALETEEIVSLHDIRVAHESDQMVQSIIRLVGSVAGISGVRRFRDWIDTLFVEDAYIYRLNSSSRNPPSK